MSLNEYHRKRRFGVTPEPRGKAPKKRRGWSFVIQKHDASRLHYDLRLELDGVLKSWAVPKGPSLDPQQRRLAVHVEDHPVEYGQFEGIIPEGEYGGGTVMLWDRGHWTPAEDDAAKAYRSGKLKFSLDGEKLHGGWMLVRRGGRSAGSEERNWFLIKERDEFVLDSDRETDITETEPLSVASGRDLDQIAADQDRVWGPRPKDKNVAVKTVKKSTKRKSAKKPSPTKRTAKRTKRKTRRKPISLDDISGARKAKLPKTAHVQLATLTDKAPADEGWLHEIKLDGYRMLCRIEQGDARFLSRHDQDWTARLSPLVAPALELPCTTALIDGEAVIQLPDGRTSFQALQNAFRGARAAPFVYFAFDLLHLDGYDLTALPLKERKRILADLVGDDAGGTIRLSEHLVGDGPQFFEQACRMGLEGIISKRRDRPYVGGRGLDWLKVKCVKHEEFVIGGFTNPKGARTGFGALLVGHYNGGPGLTYSGRVGAGFSEQLLRDLSQRLKTLQVVKSPFHNLQGKTGDARGVHWVRPELVAQVEYSERTSDGRLRHPSFQGLREDKPARQVTGEKTMAIERVQAPQSRTRKTAKKTAASKSPAVVSSKADAQVAGVRLSNPQKALYPEQGLTKLDLAQYYESIADWILPHVADRLLTLVRCPEGRGKQCFYQQHAGAGSPESLHEVPVREQKKSVKYLAIDDLTGLVSLVQMGVLELHVWGSTIDNIEHPDRLTFDLDPDPSVNWKTLTERAFEVRAFLEELGLTTFLKTTGGKGLHIVVPIARRHDWDEAKVFCKAVSDAIVTAAPRHYTSNLSKAARKGKVFIDYLRNGRGATAICAYSTRARESAPVSTPITWEELKRGLDPQNFTIKTVPARLKKLRSDPWAELASTRQSITAKMLKQLDT